MRIPRVLAVVSAALAAVTAALPAGTARADSIPPQNDAFYQPPNPLPAGRPGDVIRSRTASYPPLLGVSSTQVLYRSVNATGQAVAVSGTVLVPRTPWLGGGSRPLVSYGVGTRGLGDECAPSYTLSRGLDYEQAFINGLLLRGWAVAVTDMEGLGTPGIHTYTVGQSEGRAVLDMARAAERLPSSGLGATTPVGLQGYSQGGGSVGWAAQLAPTYAPELRIKGVSAGGVPADLVAVGKFLDGSAGMGLAFLSAVGFDTAYPELKLENYLNDAGRKLLADNKDVCLASVDGVGAIIGTAFRHITDFTTTNPLNSPTWLARFAENKLGGTKPPMPVFQAHAAADELVPLAQADTLHRTWCDAGTNLTWRTYPLAEHALGLTQAFPDMTAFLNDRFQGRPVTGNC
ncbi:lipase family protein [Actinomadura logoneensis]|uniref:lipase family protein n=1 Tax=Actinomadura logoneensis TaxID=2293572 RepID=UPI001F173F77|nr:lipase family protein [Actinomadura logoneensis]